MRLISTDFIEEMYKTNNIEEILLIEARAAKKYWGTFGNLLISKTSWHGRKAHDDDPINTLLDIGYHYLNQNIKKLCIETDIPTELGFFHKAQNKRSDPFVYDFMEWLRPLVVDSVVLHHFRKKKKYKNRLSDREVPVIINKIKNAFATKYYHRKLGYCVNLEYWTKILLLSFIKSVNENQLWKPLFPTMRHESRCKTKSRDTKSATG
jgi:CRISPR-associated endonuclease Cas1